MAEAKISFKKKLLFNTIIVVIWLVLIDVILQGAYRITTGEYTWETIHKVEVYEIKYLDKVNDERFVVPKKDYKDPDIQFDVNGFRVDGSIPSKTSKNVVFLGDSVLFGYNEKPQDTVPSRFASLMSSEGKKVGVINAALSSYSLNQAVYHYIYDVENKFPVSSIVLETYDPAENFFRLGHDWDVSKNWVSTSGDRRIGEIMHYSNSSLSYSSLYYIFWRYSGIYFKPANMTHYTNADLQNYRESIVKSLDLLLEHSKNVDQIILLPIAKPKKVYEGITLYEKEPIEVLNDVFVKYAASHPKVKFLDTRLEFQKYSDDEIYIDVCCHLTDKGSLIEATIIKDFILKGKTPQKISP